MDKAEYLFKINTGLQKYPEDFRKSVIESFNNFYQEGKRSGKSTSRILSEFGAPEYVLLEIQKLYEEESDPTSKLDRVWAEKNRTLMKDIADYRMGVSIAIPALFILLYVLHYFHVI